MGKLKMLQPRIGTCATNNLKEQPQVSWNGAKSSSALYGHKWRIRRAAFLLKNPICVRCRDEGIINAYKLQVDHIVPHKGDMELFWDETNWQTLCDSHHSHKTTTEDGGFGNLSTTGP